jgi:hypothetical protein
VLNALSRATALAGERGLLDRTPAPPRALPFPTSPMLGANGGLCMEGLCMDHRRTTRRDSTPTSSLQALPITSAQRMMTRRLQ